MLDKDYDDIIKRHRRKSQKNNILSSLAEVLVYVVLGGLVGFIVFMYIK